MPDSSVAERPALAFAAICGKRPRSVGPAPPPSDPAGLLARPRRPAPIVEGTDIRLTIEHLPSGGLNRPTSTAAGSPSSAASTFSTCATRGYTTEY